VRTSRARARGIDCDLLIKDVAKLLPAPSRRPFLRHTTSPGARALLTGCDLIVAPSSRKGQRVMSQFDDRAQARLSNPDHFGQTPPERNRAAVSAQRLLSRSDRARWR